MKTNNIRITALLLALILLASSCSYRVFSREAAATPPASTEEPPALTSTPAPTPEPGLSEEEAHNRLLVTYAQQAQDYSTEDGELLLTFSCLTPRVTVYHKEDASAAINAALTERTDCYVNGSGQEGDIHTGLQDRLEEAREIYAQMSGGEAMWMPFAMERSVSLQRGDASILSFVYEDYDHLGGAHGGLVYSGLSFDAETGQTLTLRDLAADEAALLELCLREITQQAESIQAKSSPFFEDYKDTLPSLVSDGRWYFSSSGLVFIANTYDLAPYVAGMFEFTVPYRTLRGVLHEKYQPAPRDTVQGGLNASLARQKPLSGLEALTSYTVEENGEDFILWADNSVYGIRLRRVDYLPYSGEFSDGEELLYLSRLDDGEFIRLSAMFPDVIPHLLVSWQLPDNTVQRYLITQSGKDGSILLTDPFTMEALPSELSTYLPCELDLDGDGTKEWLSLLKNDNGVWELTVNDGEIVQAQTLAFSDEISIWVSDMNGDGVSKVLLSGRTAENTWQSCVLTWQGGWQEVPFSGFLSGERSIPGRITEVTSSSLCWEGDVKILGNYTGQLSFVPDGSGGLCPEAGNVYPLEAGEQTLRTKTDIQAAMEDGTTGHFSAGTELTLTGTDGCTLASFTTESGLSGTLSLRWDNEEACWYVGEESAAEVFGTQD